MLKDILEFDSFIAQLGQELRDGYGTELNDTGMDVDRLGQLHVSGRTPVDVAEMVAIECELAPVYRRARLARVA